MIRPGDSKLTANPLWFPTVYATNTQPRVPTNPLLRSTHWNEDLFLVSPYLTFIPSGPKWSQ